MLLQLLPALQSHTAVIAVHTQRQTVAALCGAQSRQHFDVLCMSIVLGSGEEKSNGNDTKPSKLQKLIHSHLPIDGDNKVAELHAGFGGFGKLLNAADMRLHAVHIVATFHLEAIGWAIQLVGLAQPYQPQRLIGLVYWLLEKEKLSLLQ